VTVCTTAQQLLTWATVWPEQTFRRKVVAAVPFSVEELGPPTPKPEVEIWRKLHKRTRSTRFPIRH